MNSPFASHPLGVDRSAGVIRGVSIISCGEAAGHSLVVDRTTLSQIEAQGKRRGKVPVKINHGSGVDAVCGFVANFRIQGNKVLADWKLIKSHPQFAQILETAEEQPETVGLSVSFTSAESNARNVEGLAFARVKELHAVDYVAQPAANPGGLFTASVDGELVNFSATKAHAKHSSPRARLSLATRLFAFSSGEDRSEKKNSPATRLCHLAGGGTHFRTRSTLHLEAIVDTIQELSRVPGPVRRPSRAGPNTSAPTDQSRNAQGRFQPGPASSPETMRKAYSKPKVKAGLATRLRAARISADRQKQNSYT